MVGRKPKTRINHIIVISHNFLGEFSRVQLYNIYILFNNIFILKLLI